MEFSPLGSVPSGCFPFKSALFKPVEFTNLYFFNPSFLHVHLLDLRSSSHFLQEALLKQY